MNAMAKFYDPKVSYKISMLGFLVAEIQVIMSFNFSTISFFNKIHEIEVQIILT